MAVSPDTAAPFFYVLQEPLRILFVDDDPILREFAAVNLATERAAVETAPDGEAALAAVAADPPDIMLLDLEMPYLDGFGVLERLRADERHRHLPVIVVTGREDIEAVDRAFEAGATSFVVKPMNWRLLSHQIRYVHRMAQAERDGVVLDDGAAAQLKVLAMEGGRFMAAALAEAPGLKGAAKSFIAAIQAALAARDPARAA